MASIYTSNPSRATTLNPQRGRESKIVAQVRHHQVSDAAEGTKEDINYQSMTGKAQAALFFRSGNKNAIDADYANINWSVGFYDGVNQASTTFMNDPEAGGYTDTRRAHTEMGVAIRTQTTNFQGINQIYDYTDNKYDAIEINNLEMSVGLDACHSMVVPITDGLERTTVGSFSVGTGAGTISLNLPYEPDLILFQSAMRTTSPADDDAEPTSNRYEDDASWAFGAAINAAGFAQRCFHYYEFRTQPTPANHAPAFQMRNDSCIARNTAGVLDFTGAVDSNSWGTGVDIDVTAGAAGEWVIYQAFKFIDPSKVALVDTTIPSAGSAWTETGLSFKPQLVINFSSINTAFNTINTSDTMAASFTIFDAHDCWTETVTVASGVAVTGTTGTATFYNDVVVMYSPGDGVDIEYLAGEMPQMISDGWSSRLSNNPTDDVLGFAIVLGE